MIHAVRPRTKAALEREVEGKKRLRSRRGDATPCPDTLGNADGRGCRETPPLRRETRRFRGLRRKHSLRKHRQRHEGR